MLKSAFSFFFLLLLWPLGAQSWRLEKLPDLINSSCDEITPVPSRDGRTLYFTRVGCENFNRTLFIDSVDRAVTETPMQYISTLSGVYTQIAGKSIYGPVRSAFNQDVWIAMAQDSLANFISVEHPGYPLNNALPNSVMTITPDPNMLYVINQFERNGNMSRGFSYVRRTTDSSGWTFPVPIELDDFYTIQSEVSLTMSFDGKVMILAAARYDSREMDLYVCFRKGPNRWGAPQHLGNVVNSAKRELTPFLSEDNETLYFASNREESSGGFDIFKTHRLDDSWTNWTKPERLDKRINSSSDESQPYFNMTTGYLYFTSKREGSSDIYRIQIEPPQETELMVIGRVVDRSSRQLVANARILYGAEGDTTNTIEAPDGLFRLKVARGVHFNFSAQHPGYSGQPAEVYFPRQYYYFREQYIDLYVEPLSVGSKIELQPIYFQQSKAVILDKSYPELSRLAGLLLDNPNLYIRVEGHTDNIGQASELQILSEQRARAIKDFLIAKGVSPERIETIGFGARHPLNENDSEESRAQNRRVEIKVTKI